MTSPSSTPNPTLTMQFVNKTGLPDAQVYITFQDPSNTLQASYQATVGGQPQTVAIGRKSPGDMMTKSYSLATLGKTGLTIANAEGPVVFVSYQATVAKNGFAMGADLSGNAQPSYIGSGGANYAKAYQPFEITFVKGATNGQGNLTNINYFAAPISLQSYNVAPPTAGKKAPVKTLLQTRGYYGGTAAGTARLAKKLKAVTQGASSATPTKSKRILRYIGPSSYGAGANPYPSFDAYLDWLHKNNVTATIQNSNAFNTQQNPKKGNKNYNYVLDFTASFGADRTITLSGTITTIITPFGGKPKKGTVYQGAVMTLSPTKGKNTSEAIFSNTIYGQADPLGAGKGSTTFNKVWGQLKKDMAAAGLYLNTVAKGRTYVTTQNLAIGEITTGLLGGFVGSAATYQNGVGDYAKYNGQLYKDVPSEAWWNTDPIPSPSVLQPQNAFYSAYSEMIFDATGNEVYSIPYSDRFGKGPLMQTQEYDSQSVDLWVVTLGKPLFMLGPA